MQGRELPRKITAVGTLGDVGASYSVYEKNWTCPECSNENYARRQRCHRCRISKPDGPQPGSLITKGAAGDDNPWREALDPNTNTIYYYNLNTNATQWERPAEMGAAPHSTGWFGRGQAGATNSNKTFEELNAKWMKRPARLQQEQMPTHNSQLEGAYEYNIWYDKYIGDHWSQDRASREPATAKCVLERDAGRTNADVVGKSNRAFCVHFARGLCARGPECSYFHRLPTLADETRIGLMKDCFGRDRHSTDRDDMDGVGNFTRNSRTLYVAGLQQVNERPKDVQKELWKQFGEWGEVENINVIHRLSICFVRYRYRISAEFAKEAMANQALGDFADVITIRWAYDDPNPVAKEAAERADQDAVVAVIQSKGVSTTEADFEYPDQYQLPAAKRQKTIEGASYPNTDAQYDALSYTDTAAGSAAEAAAQAAEQD